MLNMNGVRETLAEIARGANQRDLTDENPFGAMKLVREARLGALRLSPAEGGYGMSIRQLFAAVMDIAEADPVVAHILRVHYWFAEERLRSKDTAVRSRWLAEIANGRLFGNALTELGGAAIGSLQFKTAITPDGDGYRLNGTKFYCTGTLFSDYINVFAARGDNTIVSPVVPTHAAGIEIVDDWDGMGARKTGSGTTNFKNVRVETKDILLELDRDKPSPPTFEFAYLQLYLQAVMAGIMRSVVSDAINVMKTRDRSFSHAPAPRPVDDPFLQQVVGELAASAFAAESTILIAAEALEDARASVQDGVPDARLSQRASLCSAQAKIHIDRVAAKAADQLFDVGGASSASRKKNLDRHWRAIRTLTLHNPTTYKAQYVGRHLIHGEDFPTNAYF